MNLQRKDSIFYTKDNSTISLNLHLNQGLNGIVVITHLKEFLLIIKCKTILYNTT